VVDNDQGQKTHDDEGKREAEAHECKNAAGAGIFTTPDAILESVPSSD